MHVEQIFSFSLIRTSPPALKKIVAACDPPKFLTKLLTLLNLLSDDNSVVGVRNGQAAQLPAAGQPSHGPALTGRLSTDIGGIITHFSDFVLRKWAHRPGVRAMMKTALPNLLSQPKPHKIAAIAPSILTGRLFPDCFSNSSLITLTF